MRALRGAVVARGLAGLALGMLESASPKTVMRADGLRPGSEPEVRFAGAHKLATGGGMLLLTKRPEAMIAAALGLAGYDALAIALRGGRRRAYVRLAALLLTDVALWYALRRRR